MTIRVRSPFYEDRKVSPTDICRLPSLNIRLPYFPWISIGFQNVTRVNSGAKTYEPRHEKMCLRESPTRQDTN